MTVQYNQFRIPVTGGDSQLQEMNKFLRTIQLFSVHRNFVENGENSFTLFTIEYSDSAKRTSIPGTGEKKEKARVDYKKILSPKDFTLFACLRDWRKETAQLEAVAVYTIFTNKQLADLAVKRPHTQTDLLDISGIGKAKVERYGDAVLQIVAGAAIT